MVGFRFRVRSQCRRRARWATPVGALVLLGALAGAPAAQADCEPTAPALSSGGLTQPAAVCPLVSAYAADPTQVLPGGTVDFDGSASSTGDPGGITEYAWDFDGDGTYDVTNPGTVPTVSHVYPTKGHFFPVLRVKDAANPSGVESSPTLISVTVPPTAQLAVTPNQAETGQSITLDANGSQDSDGTIVRYDWDFEGDGAYDVSTTTVQSVSQVYSNPGTFAPKVRVVDEDGATAVQTGSLVISAPSGGGTGGGGTGGGGTGTGTGTGGTGTGSGTGDGTGTGSGGTSDGGSTNGAGTGPAAFAASLRGSSIQSLKLVSKRGVTVSCLANRAATCKLRLEVAARDARRLGLRPRKGRPVQIGTARVTVSSNGNVGVRFSLSSRIRRALKRVGKVRVTVLGTADAASGPRVQLARIVILRR
jgi:hypothetical protein